MGDESEQKQQQEQRQPFFFSRGYIIAASIYSRTPLSIGKDYNKGKGKPDYQDGKITVRLYGGTVKRSIEKTIPDPQIFPTGRFTNGNGLNLGDYLEWNIDCPVYNFACPGAYMGGNFVNECIYEEAPAGIPFYVSYNGLTINQPVPGMKEQCQQVILIEKHLQKQNLSEKRPSLVIMSEIWPNGVFSLTYKTGLKKKWVTLTTISESDVAKLDTTLNNFMSTNVCPNLEKSIQSFQKNGLKYVVVLKDPPLDKSPYFQNIIEKHKGNKKLDKFITTMSSRCNAKIEEVVHKIQKENKDPTFHVYYAKIKYPKFPAEAYRYSNLTEDNKPTPNLPQGQKIYFNDPVHPTEKTYMKIMGPSVLKGIIKAVPPLKSYFDAKVKQTHKQEWHECFVRPTQIKKTTNIAVPLPSLFEHK